MKTIIISLVTLILISLTSCGKKEGIVVMQRMDSNGVYDKENFYQMPESEFYEKTGTDSSIDDREFTIDGATLYVVGVVYKN